MRILAADPHIWGGPESKTALTLAGKRRLLGELVRPGGGSPRQAGFSILPMQGSKMQFPAPERKCRDLVGGHDG